MDKEIDGMAKAEFFMEMHDRFAGFLMKGRDYADDVAVAALAGEFAAGLVAQIEGAAVGDEKFCRALLDTIKENRKTLDQAPSLESH